MRGAFLALVLTLLIPAAALSHAMPNSTVRLAAAGKAVTAEVQIPLSELEVAMGQKLPAAKVAVRRPELETYLRDHISLVAKDGRPWGMRIDVLMAERDHDHDILRATLSFTPPAGPDQGIALAYDAVLHKIPSHYALVFLAADGATDQPLARLQSPTTAVVIAEPAAAPAPPPPKPDTRQWWYLGGLLGLLALGAWGFYFGWRRPAKLKR